VARADLASRRTGIEVTLNGATAATVSVGSASESDTLAGVEHLRGSLGDDKMLGDKAVNTLFGLGGNDTLRGGGSLDVLDGGAGADILIGGARGVDDGVDRFVFSNAPSADIVIDFEVGIGKLVLDDDIFTRFVGTSQGVTLSAGNFRVSCSAADADADADDYLLYNAFQRSQEYDADGSGPRFAVRVTFLQTVGDVAITAAEILIVS